MYFVFLAIVTSISSVPVLNDLLNTIGYPSSRSNRAVEVTVDVSTPVDGSVAVHDQGLSIMGINHPHIFSVLPDVKRVPLFNVVNTTLTVTSLKLSRPSFAVIAKVQKGGKVIVKDILFGGSLTSGSLFHMNGGEIELERINYEDSDYLYGIVSRGTTSSKLVARDIELKNIQLGMMETLFDGQVTSLSNIRLTNITTNIKQAIQHETNARQGQHSIYEAAEFSEMYCTDVNSVSAAYSTDYPEFVKRLKTFCTCYETESSGDNYYSPCLTSFYSGISGCLAIPPSLSENYMCTVASSQFTNTESAFTGFIFSGMRAHSFHSVNNSYTRQLDTPRSNSPTATYQCADGSNTFDKDTFKDISIKNAIEAEGTEVYVKECKFIDVAYQAIDINDVYDEETYAAYNKAYLGVTGTNFTRCTTSPSGGNVIEAYCGLRILHCRFEECGTEAEDSYGRAISLVSLRDAVIANCKFIQCVTAGKGSAISARVYYPLTLTRCTFDRCRSAQDPVSMDIELSSWSKSSDAVPSNIVGSVTLSHCAFLHTSEARSNTGATDVEIDVRDVLDSSGNIPSSCISLSECFTDNQANPELAIAATGADETVLSKFSASVPVSYSATPDTAAAVETDAGYSVDKPVEASAEPEEKFATWKIVLIVVFSVLFVAICVTVVVVICLRKRSS